MPQLSTETSNTVLNTDGTYTAEVSTTPVNYQDDSGSWVPISNDLVEAPGEAYAVQNEANDYTVSIPEDPAATPVRFETDDGAWVTMKLAGSDDVSPDVEGSEASFEDLVDVADQVAYEAMSTGVKETITVASMPTAPISFKYTLNTSPDITPVLTAGNEVEFRNAAGAVQFSMPAPNMSDSAAPLAAYSDDVSYSLASQDSTWKLVVTPDHSWLTDPERTYPVLVDPTIDKADTMDCWILRDSPDAPHCQNEYLYAGLSSGSLRRSLLAFPMGWLPSNAAVSSATLFLFLDATGTTGNGTANFGLYQPNAVWTPNATWNKRNGIATWSNGGTSDNALSPTAPPINAGSSSSWYQWDVKHTVKGWQEDPITNRGFMVRSTTESTNRQVRFVSGNSAGWHPLLRFTYTLAPSGPVELDMSGCAQFCSKRYSLASTLRPTLRAVAQDSDSSSLLYTFALADFETDAVIAYGQRSAAPGTPVSWQTPQLDPNGTYEWNVAVQDESTVVWNTSFRYFNVYIPQPPGVSSLGIGPCGDSSCPQTSPVVSSKSPTLSARLSDSDSTWIDATFELRMTGSTSPLYSTQILSESEVGSDVTVPPGILQDGMHYEYRVLPSAEGIAGTASAWFPFSVDLPVGPLEPLNFHVSSTSCPSPCTQLFDTSSPRLTTTSGATTPTTIRFEIWEGQALVGSDDIENVAPGATVNWNVPAGLMNSGHYAARAGSSDGTHTTWTTWRDVDLLLSPGSDSGLSDPSVGYEDPNREFSAGYDFTRTPSAAVNASDEQNGTADSGYQDAAGEPKPTEPDVKYAPVLEIDKQDWSQPMSATKFINNSTLTWHHHAFDYRCHEFPMVRAPQPSKLALTNDQAFNHYENAVDSCNVHAANYWPWEDVRAGEQEDSVYPVLGQGMYLNLDDDWREGEAFNENAPPPAYEKVKYLGGKVKWAHYWFNYGQSVSIRAGGTRWAYHEGDWEHVAISFGADERPIMVKYYFHWTSCVAPYDDVPHFGSTDGPPHVDVAQNSHGNYPRGWDTINGDTRTDDWTPNVWRTGLNLKRMPNTRGQQYTAVPWWGFTGGWGGTLPDVGQETTGSVTQFSPDAPSLLFRNYTPGFGSNRYCTP